MQVLYNKLEKYLSLSIYKTIYFIQINFVFSTENNYNIYEGEQILIYLVRPTTKEEKTPQYDMNTHENVIILNQISMWMCS